MNEYLRARQKILAFIKRNHPDVNHSADAHKKTLFALECLKLANRNRTEKIPYRHVGQAFKLLK